MTFKEYLKEEPPNYETKEAAERKAESLSKKNNKKYSVSFVKDLGWIITEAYAFRVKPRYGKNFDVFVNPSLSELKKENIEDFRFIAFDNKKKVYIWNAAFGTYRDVANYLQMTGAYYYDPNILEGNGIVRAIPIVQASDQLDWMLRSSRQER